MTREEQRQAEIEAQVHRVANGVATVAWWISGRLGICVAKIDGLAQDVYAVSNGVAKISDIFDALGHRALDAAIAYSDKRFQEEMQD